MSARELKFTPKPLDPKRIFEVAERTASDLLFRDVVSRLHKALEANLISGNHEVVVFTSYSEVDWQDALGYALYLRENERVFGSNKVEYVTEWIEIETFGGMPHRIPVRRKKTDRATF